MLGPCAVVLCLAAWGRGAEYDEQYTLFLTAGMPRPDWPVTAFPAGLAREWQNGHIGPGDIGEALRRTDVHPPLYFWLIAAWRAVLGGGLFAARLFSVVCAVAALGLVGGIARAALLPPRTAILLTLGCYGFVYTSAIARGFALAQVFLLAGMLIALSGKRDWRWFVLAGALWGAATLTNYLAVFVAAAALAGLAVSDRRRLLPALAGFIAFIPLDLWWFLAQRGSRDGQFPPFSWIGALTRLAERGAGTILGGLPLYVDGIASLALTGALGLVLAGLTVAVIVHWRRIGTPDARILFAFAAVAPGLGLLALGFLFNNAPIELRYLAFATPFVGLLLAGALPRRHVIGLLAVQAASIAGLILAPQTMQPARAAAHAAAVQVGSGVVLLPRGNDGVGAPGAFAIEAQSAMRLLLISGHDTPETILARVANEHRVVLALLEQDAMSAAAVATVRRAFAGPPWREVARGPHILVYER